MKYGMPWLCLAVMALCMASVGCDDGDSAAVDGAAPDVEVDGAVEPDPEPDAAPMDDAGPVPDMAPRPDMGDPCGCPGRQTCVDGDCVEPAMCMGHEDCVAPRACVDGACEDRCREDTDCPGALRCDTASQACVEVTPCDGDSGCFAGRRCIDGMCTDPCDRDDDCPGAQVCDVPSGRCAAPDVCAGDGDCPGGGVCIAGACVPPCLEAADCPGAQRCIDGLCAEPEACTGAGDCQGDRICVAGGCVDPCGRAGCEGGLMCDMASGRCEEAMPCLGDDGCRAPRRCLDMACADPCLEAADCPGAQQCLDGRCEEPGECFGDDDCAGDRICDAGACAEPCGRGGCEGALVCDQATGRCGEASPCRLDAECRGERACVDGACTDPCRENADCPGNLACGADGRCGEPDRCLADLDCFGDRVCVDLACSDPCGPGLPCRGTQLCEAGRCVEGPDCADDRDCLGGRRCHPEGQVCVDGCRDDADCFGGQRCTDGLCGERDVCDGDGNCLGERQCRLGQCRTVRCEDGGECPAGEVCVDWQCRAAAPGACECVAGWGCVGDVCIAPGPCMGDGDCPGACRVDGTCGECREDADCPGASSCRNSSCAEPAVCLGPGACLPGRVCGPANICVGDPDCAEDALDGNDIPDAAAVLPAMAVTGLVACDGVDDWYRTATDDTLRIVARYASDARPLELSLYDIFDEFDPIDEDRGSPGQSWVSAGAPGEYLLRVRRPPGGAEVYDLEVMVGSACVDDGFERPWRNDIEANAAPIDGTVSASLCPGPDGADVDWYRYVGQGPVAVDGGGVAVTVGGQPAGVVQPGQTIRVSGEPGRYGLRLEAVRDPVGRCAAAEALALGAPRAVFVQQGPDDFAPGCFPEGVADAVYRIELPAPGGLRATFDGFPPMAAMALYADCAAGPLECSAGVGALEVEALEAGVYFLAIDGPVDGDLLVESVADFACADAPAIAIGAPQVVQLAPTPGRIAGGCIGGGPLAVRRLSLDGPATVRVSAEGDAQLSLTVRGDCEAPGSELGCGLGFAPTVEAGVLAAGDYYVVVEGGGEATLTVEAAPVGEVLTIADDCAGPVGGLPVDFPVQLDGNTAGAGDRVDASVCGVAPGGADQVLRFRLDRRAAVRAELATAGHLGFLMLLDGQCGGAPVCGMQINPAVDAVLDPGDYALVIDGQGPGDAGAFQVRLTASPR